MSARIKKITISLLVLGAVALALLQPMDHLGDQYIDSAFKRALLGFAIARGLNGVISVAQGTEIAFQPAGVGVNFTPGEILDPVNDLVERFSWVMLLASSSLGIQKTLLAMSGWTGFGIILAVAAVFFLLTQWTKHFSTEPIKRFASRLFIIVLVLRFLMPIVALGNEWFYQHFLAAQYEHSTAQLENVRDKVGKINEEVMEDGEVNNGSGALVDRARQLYRSTVKRIDFDQRLEDYKAAVEDLSENAINLIVVFSMQTVVLPMLFLWVAVTLVKRWLQ